MRVYSLSCFHGHAFDGWFASSAEFDRQQAGGEIRCPLCDDRSVTRLPSAPYVKTGARATPPLPAASNESRTPDLATAIAALKAYVRTHTENVGREFPDVARRMHHGEEPPRGIRGRVTAGEAEALQDEGIEAFALPPGVAPDEILH